MAQLEDLNLRVNKFTGPIPDQLGLLALLERLQLSFNVFGGDIPAELTALVALNPTYRDLGYNSLSASNTDLLAFLATKDPDWSATQTVAPADLQIVTHVGDRVELAWTPIAYQGGFGYYEIGHATSSGGPYNWVQTANKGVSSITLSGLVEDADHDFVMRTFTAASGSQQNAITSEPSPEVTTSGGNPVPATLTGSFTIEGRTTQSLPLDVNLYEVGAATPSYSFTPTGSSAGEFVVSGIAPGSMR